MGKYDFNGKKLNKNKNDRRQKVATGAVRKGGKIEIDGKSEKEGDRSACVMMMMSCVCDHKLCVCVIMMNRV